MDREADVESENYVGRVSYRPLRGDTSSLPDAVGSPRNNSNTPRNAYAHSFVPLRTEGMAQSPNPRRPGSPLSEPDFMPDMGTTERMPPSGGAAKEDSWFKSWLTVGILDVLGAAAGVTLSTTGKLVAPPLQMTKTLIIPGLLALMVDTLDAVTPPRVQDWFRILSSSLHHLMTVLRSTDKGKIFSSQVYIVLQDILKALSAPESRQVLVDGMATSVKFAAALHTPEMLEFLEQLGTLGIRLLDAASSGKAKQLMQDTRDMTWKGIEMATDPSTTLALAEVTAHLCHALEDTQQALNSTPRKRRDEQNQKVYLNPYQMADFPEQVTMEEVILSCLGLVEANKSEAVGDDGASLPSRLTLDEDLLSLPEPDWKQEDWKERKERVNVQLLKERILKEGLAKSRVKNTKPPSVAPPMDEVSASNQQAREELNMDGLAGLTNEYTNTSAMGATHDQEQDMEDIAWSAVPGGRRLGIKESDKAKSSAEDRAPAIQQFYEKLDELLEQNRQRAQSHRGRQESTINNSLEKEDDTSNPWNVWKARIKKLKEPQGPKVLERDSLNRSTNIGRIPKQYRRLIITVLSVGMLLFAIFSGLAMYGVYALVKGNSVVSVGSRNHVAASSLSQDIVIRIVREVVHVTENGEIVGESGPQVLTQEELEKIGQNVAAALR